MIDGRRPLCRLSRRRDRVSPDGTASQSRAGGRGEVRYMRGFRRTARPGASRSVGPDHHQCRDDQRPARRSASTRLCRLCARYRDRWTPFARWSTTWSICTRSSAATLCPRPKRSTSRTWRAALPACWRCGRQAAGPARCPGETETLPATGEFKRVLQIADEPGKQRDPLRARRRDGLDAAERTRSRLA